MKILQVSTAFKPSWIGGVPRSVYEISKQLTKKGNDVTVYTTDIGQERLKVPKNKPINVENIKTYYFRNVSNFIAMKLKIVTPYYLPFIAKKELSKFDIVHIHEHRTIIALMVYYYAKKFNIPYIIQARGSLPYHSQKKSLKKIFDVLFGNKILLNANAVIALTEDEVKQYQNLGVDSDKINIIPNGIDLSYCCNVKKGNFRKKNHLKTDEHVILYLGRINRIKGLDLLIESFYELLKDLNNVKLVIVGYDDGFLSSLKSLIKNRGIENKVLFTGPLYEKEKMEVYLDSDVFVLPSSYDAFPNTVFEALSMNTPVIINKNCSIKYILKKHDAGIIIKNKEELKAALISILTNEKLKKSLEINGKALVKDFEWSNVVNEMKKVYLKLQ